MHEECPEGCPHNWKGKCQAIREELNEIAGDRCREILKIRRARRQLKDICNRTNEQIDAIVAYSKLAFELKEYWRKENARNK